MSTNDIRYWLILYLSKRSSSMTHLLKLLHHYYLLISKWDDWIFMIDIITNNLLTTIYQRTRTIFRHSPIRSINSCSLVYQWSTHIAHLFPQNVVGIYLFKITRDPQISADISRSDLHHLLDGASDDGLIQCIIFYFIRRLATLSVVWENDLNTIHQYFLLGVCWQGLS